VKIIFLALLFSFSGTAWAITQGECVDGQYRDDGYWSEGCYWVNGYCYTTDRIQTPTHHCETQCDDLQTNCHTDCIDNYCGTMNPRPSAYQELEQEQKEANDAQMDTLRRELKANLGVSDNN